MKQLALISDKPLLGCDVRFKTKQQPPPFLLTTRESTQFNRESEYTLDVEQFVVAMRGCERHHSQRNGRCSDCIIQLEQGINLYCGSFLDGFFLESSSEFDKWVLGQKERWQQAALIAYQELADYHEQHGNYGLASQYIQRRLEIEPWDEAALRQQMRLLMVQGQRNTALAQYQAFTKLVKQELGVEPESETAVLRDQIAAAKQDRPAQLPEREQTFIGRIEELGRIQQQLVTPDSRLVTLVGPGGIGKTRLAIETGWRVASDRIGPFWHGVYFVPLAGIVPGETPNKGFNPLVTAVAEALGFTFAGHNDPQEQLLTYLQDKSLLLILDNFEHLAQTGRALLLALLKQTTNLKILVTSRERLNIMSEWTLAVDGLPVPKTSNINEVDMDDAPALFVQRAHQIDAQFALTQPGESGACQQTAVIRICQLLHGIPLAIELAAAWVRLLTCDEIAQEIEQNLDALSSQAHDVPERHRSMRAVFTYSWELLTPDEQMVTHQLSAFHGGFSREAALAVTGATLPQLAALLDKSLLTRNDITVDNSADSRPVTRYHMLETLRQFAYEKLTAVPAEEQNIQKKHIAFYLSFLQRRETDLRGQRQQTALREIRQEIENIRLAWQLALDQADWAAIDQAVAALSLFYYMRSWFAEGADLFSQSITRLEEAGNVETAVLHAKLLARQGWFTFLLGHPTQAQTLLAQSLKQLRPFPASADHIYALVFLAVVTYNQDDFATAQQLAEEGLAISQTLGDRYYEAIANNILSQIAYLQDDYHAAQTYSEQSLTIEREIGNRWSIGFSLTNLGRVAFAQGDFATAQTHLQESLLIREALQDSRGQAICHNYLGATARALGNLAAAAEHYQASLVLSREISSEAGIVFALNRLENLSSAQET